MTPDKSSLTRSCTRWGLADYEGFSTDVILDMIAQEECDSNPFTVLEYLLVDDYLYDEDGVICGWTEITPDSVDGSELLENDFELGPMSFFVTQTYTVEPPDCPTDDIDFTPDSYTSPMYDSLPEIIEDIDHSDSFRDREQPESIIIN